MQNLKPWFRTNQLRIAISCSCAGLVAAYLPLSTPVSIAVFWCLAGLLIWLMRSPLPFDKDDKNQAKDDMGQAALIGKQVRVDVDNADDGD